MFRNGHTLIMWNDWTIRIQTSQSSNSCCSSTTQWSYLLG